MVRDVILRDGIEARVFNRHSGFLADRLEPHLDVGHLGGLETRLAPGQREARNGPQSVVRPISKTAPSAQVSVNWPSGFG